MVEIQNMFDKLNATKILLILFWEADINNFEYISHLLKFKIKLLRG